MGEDGLSAPLTGAVYTCDATRARVSCEMVYPECDSGRRGEPLALAETPHRAALATPTTRLSWDFRTKPRRFRLEGVGHRSRVGGGKSGTESARILKQHARPTPASRQASTPRESGATLRGNAALVIVRRPPTRIPRFGIVDISATRGLRALFRRGFNCGARRSRTRSARQSGPSAAPRRL